MSRIKPPFKYYGGKFYLCNWIISNLPQHTIYVEPFGGAASVLLNKPRSEVEIYNDLNSDISNLMKFIRDDESYLTNQLKQIPCEEKIYYQWKEKAPTDILEAAIRCFVILRMSRGGTGTTFSKSNRIYGGLPENISSWNSSISNLKIVSERLQGVEIRNQDGLKLVQEFNSPQITLYLDPPYLGTIRKNPKVYDLEMSDDIHRELANFCNQSNSKILVSSYESELYSTLFSNWTYEEKSQFLHGGHGRNKRIKNEILWKNF